MKELNLKIGGVPEHFNLPWNLAVEEGELERAGIRLNWTDMYGGTGQTIGRLMDGRLDAAVILTEGITKAILEGLDAKIFQVCVTTPLHWGIHVPFFALELQETKDLEGKTFAISRKGSGSELMAYVLAKREGWISANMRFQEVGDLNGGLRALHLNTAQVFLWDKYMTNPYVLNEKCRYIGEVITPWPSFVLAVKTEIVGKYYQELLKMTDIVNRKAKMMKENQGTIALLSERFSLQPETAKSWLKETDWNYEGKSSSEDFGYVIDRMVSYNLISKESAIDYSKRLFYTANTR